jgi:hypothetical protein
MSITDWPLTLLQPEWYASRVGLSLAYLAAESHLLRPFPTPSAQLGVSASTASANPHLPSAIIALRRNLKWCDDAARSVQDVEQGAGDLMGFAKFVGKSWAGLIRSRYW